MSLDSILRSIGKNLFDINTTPTFTRTGATYTVSGTTITFKSNNTTNNSFFYSIPVEIGKTYTVSVSSIDWDSTSLGMFLSATNSSDLKDYGIINKTTLSKTFTTTSDTLWIHGYLSYAAGDFTFSFDKLQVEEGSTATSYEPYQQGPKSIRIGDKEVLKVSYGSKNLIPYPYTDTTKTFNGITFTVNSDGSVTVNGTATEQAYFKLQQSFSLKKGQYFFSGCPKGGAGSTYSLYLSNTDYTFYKADIGNGISINSEDDKTVSIVINIAKDTTVENLVFKPQLEIGDKATEYVPYSKEVVWTKT